jgi:hypothetical protein
MTNVTGSVGVTLTRSFVIPRVSFPGHF